MMKHFFILALWCTYSLGDRNWPPPKNESCGTHASTSLVSTSTVSDLYGGLPGSSSVSGHGGSGIFPVGTETSILGSDSPTSLGPDATESTGIGSSQTQPTCVASASTGSEVPPGGGESTSRAGTPSGSNTLPVTYGPGATSTDVTNSSDSSTTGVILTVPASGEPIGSETLVVPGSTESGESSAFSSENPSGMKTAGGLTTVPGSMESGTASTGSGGSSVTDREVNSGIESTGVSVSTSGSTGAGGSSAVSSDSASQGAGETDSAGVPLTTDSTGAGGSPPKSSAIISEVVSNRESAGVPATTGSTDAGGSSESSSGAASGIITDTEPTAAPGGISTPAEGVLSTTVPGSISDTTVPSLPITTTQSNEGGIVSTMTEPPAGFSPTMASDHPEWTTNTWIPTTSEDSSEPTVVPLLVGCDECGDDGECILIFGFPPVVDTLFKFPGWPSFSLPCIPILDPGCSLPPKAYKDDGTEDDGDDDDDDDDSSTSEEASSTCTEEVTASDCLVACTTYTEETDATRTPDCTTTCTRTYTGCSVTGVTSTTSAEACDATGENCTTCTRWPGLDSPDPDAVYDESEYYEDEDELEARDLDLLQARGKKVMTLGRRVDDPVNDPEGVGLCEQKGGLDLPKYIGGLRLLNKDQEGKLTAEQREITKWYVINGLGTCTPSVKEVNPTGYLEILGNLEKTNTPSVDHVFEKSFLKDFFEITLNDSGDSWVGTKNPEQMTIKCSDLEYYTYNAETNKNRLQVVFDAYPSIVKFQFDLIGMQQALNGDAKVCAQNSRRTRNIWANTIQRGKVATTSGKLALGRLTQEKWPTRWIIRPGKRLTTR